MHTAGGQPCRHATSAHDPRPGFFTHAFGATACSVCPRGAFCPQPDRELACPAGSYCPEGSHVPTPCASPGDLCLGGDGAPQDCPPGFYCPTPAEQLHCPAGLDCPLRSVAPRSPPEAPPRIDLATVVGLLAAGAVLAAVWLAARRRAPGAANGAVFTLGASVITLVTNALLAAELRAQAAQRPQDQRLLDGLFLAVLLAMLADMLLNLAAMARIFRRELRAVPVAGWLRSHQTVAGAVCAVATTNVACVNALRSGLGGLASFSAPLSAAVELDCTRAGLLSFVVEALPLLLVQAIYVSYAGLTRAAVVSFIGNSLGAAALLWKSVLRLCAERGGGGGDAGFEDDGVPRRGSASNGVADVQDEPLLPEVRWLCRAHEGAVHAPCCRRLGQKATIRSIRDGTPCCTA
jgi:hypothetical protein